MNEIIPNPEDKFVEYYVETLNKRIAYEKAFGPDEKALAKANKLLQREDIASRISDEMQKKLDSDVAKSPALLLKYIEQYLQLDPADFYTDDGRVIPLSQLSPENRILISNINKQINVRDGKVLLTYNLPDKLKLLDHLSRLVAFVAQVRALTNKDDSNAEEAERKRKEILEDFDEDVSFETTQYKIESEIKKAKRKKKKTEE